MFSKAGELCKEYISTKGAGSTIHPNEHQFYTNYAKDMTRKLEKCKNENGFMYVFITLITLVLTNVLIIFSCRVQTKCKHLKVGRYLCWPVHLLFLISQGLHKFGQVSSRGFSENLITI